MQSADRLGKQWGDAHLHQSRPESGIRYSLGRDRIGYDDLLDATRRKRPRRVHDQRARATQQGRTDALCRRFATGGGRAAAAGINHLPQDQLPEFVRQMDQAFP